MTAGSYESQPQELINPSFPRQLMDVPRAAWLQASRTHLCVHHSMTDCERESRKRSLKFSRVTGDTRPLVMYILYSLQYVKGTFGEQMSGHTLPLLPGSRGSEGRQNGGRDGCRIVY